MLLERKKIAMVGAEFLGTAILTEVVLSVSKSNLGIPYFVALAAGLTIAAGTMVFGAVSGAHFNPIVTIGLLSARRVKPLPAVVYVAAQLLGAMAAYGLFVYLVVPEVKWPQPGHYSATVLIAEAVGGFVFSMGWAAAMYNKLEAGKAAFVTAASLIAGIVVASVGSDGVLNPAVALGLHNWVWSTYVLGPILGAVIGFNLYALLFAPAASLVEAPSKKK